MALTKEQFSALRQKGLSTEQIVKFSSQTKPEQPKPKYPAEDILSSAVGPAYKVAKGVAQGYGNVREAVTEPISQLVPGGGPKFPMSAPNPMMPVTQIPLGKMTGREALKETAGMGLDQLLTMGLGKAIPIGARAGAKMTEATSVKNMTKAKDLFRKILPSKSAEQTAANLSMKELPEVEVGVGLVKKSKNYGQLKESFLGAKKEAITQREGELGSAMYQEIKDPVSKLTSKLQTRIKNLKASKRAEPGEISKLEKILEREQGALIEDTERMNIDKAEALKEFYQQKAQELYKKAQSGTITGNEKSQLGAYADLADDAKNLVDELASVSPTNRTIQGSGRAAKIAAEQETAFQQRKPQGLLFELLQSLRGGPNATGAAVIRGHFGKEVPLSKTTGKIEKLVKSYKNIEGVTDVLKKISQFGQKTPKAPTPTSPLLLEGPKSEPQGPLALDYQSFQMLSPDEQAIALSEYKKKIASVFNPQGPLALPEPPSSVIPVSRVGSPKEGPFKPKLKSDLNTTLAELMKRRKSNFK